MVIVKLIGGLGNQMFQYAAGRSLACRLNTTLKLDISLFKQYPDRFYALKDFNIQEKIASSKEIYTFSGIPQTIGQKIVDRIKNRTPLVRKILALRYCLPFGRRVSGRHSFIYTEPHFHFDPKFFRLGNDVYLDGYWQSEKYFSNIADFIRQEFTGKTPLEGKNLEIFKQIQNCDSVSLHIRRGDYAANPTTTRIHGVCSLEYYRIAINKLTEELEEPYFFIFSDDPSWAKRRLQTSSFLIYFDYNGPESAHEDLRLMAKCKHNIIANSTFSWWGAWLNQNPDKILLAPKRWFSADEYNTKDLFPDGWTKI